MASTNPTLTFKLCYFGAERLGLEIWTGGALLGCIEKEPTVEAARYLNGTSIQALFAEWLREDEDD